MAKPPPRRSQFDDLALTWYATCRYSFGKLEGVRRRRPRRLLSPEVHPLTPCAPLLPAQAPIAVSKSSCFPKCPRQTRITPLGESRGGAA